ncbi:acyl-ACP thioesterase domain-containing protein [uncultured Sunxiuqinia sp.]|uniref:acyl-[acyl-carrier-protein] thioesterase n=1 Tax=uncultured Sunxiuqinia sp. TaxID=1573825 RepID=UPI00262776C4|nr:acyl-ACP thioesterase domain-containing protein [uncultured Sunxiuqinia sp.]
MNKYSQKITIGAYHTNQHAQASVTSLFNVMLEAAWAHAQVMEWGYEDLKSNNMFWVLSRVYFEIEKYPEWQDQITLNTWSSGTDGMYAYREFILENEQQEVLLRASTAWLILNLENRRIFRLRDLRNSFPRLEAPNVCRNPKRIKPHARSGELSFQAVLFSDLDVNKHFNSVKYLERVLDGFGIDFLNTFELAQLEINYLKEGLAGDKLAVDTISVSDSSFSSTIVRESDGLELCSMLTHWRKRRQ